MLKKMLYLLVLLLFLFSFYGCYTVKIGATSGDVKMTPSTKGKVIGKIDEKKAVPFFFYGLGQTQKVDISKILKVINVKNAANIEIDYGFSFVDMLVSGLSMGIYTPKTVKIRGDMIENN